VLEEVMLFQTIDDKKECSGIFHDGKLVYNPVNFPDNLTRTWKYTASLEGYRGVDYAEIYVLGKTLDEVCPDHLQEEWQQVKGRMQAFFKANATAKISTSQHCLFDLIPEKFLKDLCHIKNQISDWVISKWKRPPNYKHLLSTLEMLRDTETYELQVDPLKLRSIKNDVSARLVSERIGKGRRTVKYNLFSTKTGRLTCTSKSFPIFTLKKEHRGILVPKRDMFVELDFNGAELRTLLALSGQEQPLGDVHDWNVKNVFNREVSREESKVLFFSWLYGSASESLKKWRSSLSKTYDTRTLKSKHFDVGLLMTPYGREIAVSDRLFINYLIQSTTADLCYEQFRKVWEVLKGSKSEVAFFLHDAIVIDLSVEDRGLIEEMMRVMSQTRYGQYGVNVSIGRNYGDMRKTKFGL
jgi:hypothetical protein